MDRISLKTSQIRDIDSRIRRPASGREPRNRIVRKMMMRIVPLHQDRLPTGAILPDGRNFRRNESHCEAAAAAL
jgi:hypothetical protein